MTKDFSPFPLWGPYSKKYAGLSKITEVNDQPASRFDFTTVPGVMGFDIRVPNVTLPTAYHPWLASADLSFFSFRHDLEWKDVVYADVSYSKINDHATLVRTELTNNSNLTKNFVINHFYSLELPVGKPFMPALPNKCEFINACDYCSYEYAIPRPWDEQNPDGMKKGVFPDCEFSSCHGLGDRVPKWHMPHKVLKPFGGEKGDRVSYNIKIQHEYSNPVFIARYRSVDIEYRQGEMVGVNLCRSDNTAEFTVLGKSLILQPTDKLNYAVIPLDEISGNIELVSTGKGAVEFDFFAICEAEDAEIITSKLRNEADPDAVVPQTDIEQNDNHWLMHSKYKDCDDEFFLKIYEQNTRFRKVATGCLEDCMSARMSNADESFDDLTESFTGAFNRKHSDDGFFENSISHTILVEPGSSTVRYSIISDEEIDDYSEEELERIYTEKKNQAIKLNFNSDGTKYSLSNQLLTAAIMTNIVYPIYKHGEYIIHPTPGKRWDCLYTWDLGFIGLGTNEYAREISSYILETYLSDESNPDYAFLHHGSPVPTQAYQVFEMLQKENDKSRLLALYPKFRLYYHFLSGKIRHSTTNKFSSNILSTYDYFYSTSGMDDYPAQVAMMKDTIRDTTSPVLTSGTVIRFAKILEILADRLGKEDDIEEYKADVKKFTDGLNKYSWDEESGYFSYVCHDENYNPVKKYQTADGENLSKGLDGIYPIVAGILDDRQKEAILSHLKSEKEMLSPYGISAVDQSASYYKVNGYWNGNIWFPHQWILWKTMLDLGENDFAFEIARRALDIWKREVDSTYYTFEMVNVTTGNGGWFHNFGGLSAPINLWAKAYFVPGTINAGFDSFIENYEFSADLTSCRLKLKHYGNQNKATLLICLKEGKEYSVKINGQPHSAVMRTNGCVEINLETEENKEYIIETGENYEAT